MKKYFKKLKVEKETTYIYRLLNKIDPALNLLPYADDIIEIVKSYGGYDVMVYERGYSYKVSRCLVFTSGTKRNIGKDIANIDGIGCYAYKRDYTYSDGTPAKSSQLFKRVKKMKF